MTVFGGSVQQRLAIQCSGRNIRPSLDQHVEALEMSTLYCSHDCCASILRVEKHRV
eukprot:m.167767 g.167767  ORF g.167767 m.167767 type:complete len:56 (-) comp53182_c0_seq4:396-563(-)